MMRRRLAEVGVFCGSATIAESPDQFMYMVGTIATWSAPARTAASREAIASRPASPWRVHSVSATPRCHDAVSSGDASATRGVAAPAEAAHVSASASAIPAVRPPRT